jgi:hypothetical protein
VAQIFHPSTNTISKVSVIGAILLIAALIVGFGTFARSSYVSKVDVAIQQPVPFSHEHHVSGIGIDCRYCHTSVEESSFAGMPATEVCMNCHSQIWADSPILEPIRESFRTGKPIAWKRVYDLPDFVYFDHSIHISKGVGCDTCHGRVDRMPLLWKAETLYMEWCLECHRAPERFIRPRDQVFNAAWQPPANQLASGRGLVKEYDIQVEQLANCSICHR